MNEKYKPIQCGDYDFLEIACMDGYELDVVKAAETIRGKAVTTENNETGEFLIIEQSDGSQVKIRADEIKKLLVLDENARFNEHVFN